MGEFLLKKCKEVKLSEKAKDNDGYEFSLINPGFLGAELMTKGETLEPDADNAVITFFRQGDSSRNFAFGLWDKNGYIGTLKGLTYFQIKVPAGKHYFVGKSDKVAVVEADVEAGKNYLHRA